MLVAWQFFLQEKMLFLILCISTSNQLPSWLVWDEDLLFAPSYLASSF